MARETARFGALNGGCRHVVVFLLFVHLVLGRRRLELRSPRSDGLFREGLGQVFDAECLLLRDAMAFEEIPKMAPEFRVVDEEQNGVYDGHAVCEDVQNIHHVLEMRFLVAVAEILNKPHDLMGQKEDGEHDHV